MEKLKSIIRETDITYVDKALKYTNMKQQAWNTHQYKRFTGVITRTSSKKWHQQQSIQVKMNWEQILLNSFIPVCVLCSVIEVWYDLLCLCYARAFLHTKNSIPNTWTNYVSTLQGNKQFIFIWNGELRVFLNCCFRWYDFIGVCWKWYGKEKLQLISLYCNQTP